MIDSYSFGSITIDGIKFTKDLIIYPDYINSSWRRKTGHLLTEDDIKEILDYKPEVLIIGTGASGFMKVDDMVKEKLKILGIEFIIKKTAEAESPYPDENSEYAFLKNMGINFDVSLFGIPNVGSNRIEEGFIVQDNGLLILSKLIDSLKKEFLSNI